MRNPLIVATLALLATGCVLPQPAVAPYPMSPLAAHFVSPEPQLQFELSRPGYAAVFEIVPGAGTRLLFPSPGRGTLGGQLDAGARVFHGVVHIDPADRSFARADAARSGSSRHLFLIASDHPLTLGELAPDGYVSSVALWDPRFSGSPDETMERLVRMTVPRVVDDGSWSTDFYADAPWTSSEAHSGRHAVLMCNGHEVLVREEESARVQAELCAGTSNHQAPQESAAPASGVPPRTSRPVPGRLDEESGLPAQSGQLEKPSGRNPAPRPSKKPVPSESGSGRPSPPSKASPPGGTAADPTRDDDERAAPASPAEANGRRTPAIPATRATPPTPANAQERASRAKPRTPADVSGRGKPATPANPNGPGNRATPATPANAGSRGKPTAAPSARNGGNGVTPAGGPGSGKAAAPANANGGGNRPTTAPAAAGAGSGKAAAPANANGGGNRPTTAEPAGGAGNGNAASSSRNGGGNRPTTATPAPGAGSGSPTAPASANGGGNRPTTAAPSGGGNQGAPALPAGGRGNLATPADASAPGTPGAESPVTPQDTSNADEPVTAPHPDVSPPSAVPGEDPPVAPADSTRQRGNGPPPASEKSGQPAGSRGGRGA